MVFRFFLLEYETLEQLKGTQTKPGRQQDPRNRTRWVLPWFCPSTCIVKYLVYQKKKQMKQLV